MHFDKERQAMVQSQLRPNGIQDKALLQAYLQHPRHLFLEQEKGGQAYIDEDLAVGEGRYLLEPVVEARMLQHARIRTNDLVLVVGAWPGNLSSLAARLGSAVIALESNAEKITQLQTIFDKAQIPNIFVTQQDITQGYPLRAPYDVILFGGAVDQANPIILDQLNEGGRLIAIERPVPQHPGVLCCYRRQGTHSDRRVICEAFTPLLPEFAAKREKFKL